MAILLDKPITVPAQPARVADKLWLVSLNISAPSPTSKARVSALLAPYVGDTGEVLRDKAKMLVIDDVLTQAASDASLAATLEAVFTEIDRQARAVGLF